MKRAPVPSLVPCVHPDLVAGRVEVLCAEACDREALLAALERRNPRGAFVEPEAADGGR